jgi:HEAT repeat protein
MGPVGAAAAPALRWTLRDPDGGVRLSAALALCRRGRHQQAAVAVIVRALEYRPDAFATVADTLAALGPEARAAVPWLQALRHEDYTFHRAAAETLEKIDPQAAAKAGVP